MRLDVFVFGGVWVECDGFDHDNEIAKNHSIV